MIVRIDPADGQPKKYCCQCKPRQTIELFGHPLAETKTCEVENELCPFSNHLKKESPK
jgi:hypothetical protein